MAFIRPSRLRSLLIITCIFAAVFLLLRFYHKDNSASTSYESEKGSTSYGTSRSSRKKERYPIKPSAMYRIPEAKALKLPPLQFDFDPESAVDRSARELRRQAVKDSFLHAWTGYTSQAWMQDEVLPISGGYRSGFGGWGATLLDSLDTLWIMGMREEFEHAVKAVAEIDFSTPRQDEINVFETTIRYLGGLLSAYDLTDGQHPVLLDKATQLGNLLYSAFDTPNRMPVIRWQWKNSGKQMQEAAINALAAELGSLTLEFTRLSQLTDDPKFYDAIHRVMLQFEEGQRSTRLPGLWPTTVNARALSWKGTAFTLNGMADSLYEYLPKQYLLLGGLNDMYKNMYMRAIKPMKEYIFFRPMVPDSRDILISGGARYRANERAVMPDPQGQHLGCFTGGMVAIGAKIWKRPEDMVIARKLVDGCVWAYNSTQSGIMPESFHLVRCSNFEHCAWVEKLWHDAVLLQQPKHEATEMIDRERRIKGIIQEKHLPPGYTDIDDTRYVLRPEAIESLFILYRLTGDRALQDSAWEIFQTVERHTKTRIAHASLLDVTLKEPQKYDRMESFWLAETLKYFYLIFSEPELVNLDEYVLNTEAHPFKRPVT